MKIFVKEGKNSDLNTFFLLFGPTALTLTLTNSLTLTLTNDLMTSTLFKGNIFKVHSIAVSHAIM